MAAESGEQAPADQAAWAAPAALPVRAEVHEHDPAGDGQQDDRGQP
jgi:hypothetical protein